MRTTSMTRTLVCTIALLLAGWLVRAQAPAAQTVLLWPPGAPGALGNDDADKPSLEIFPAPAASKVPTAVIVFPGGGYI